MNKQTRKKKKKQTNKTTHTNTDNEISLRLNIFVPNKIIFQFFYLFMWLAE